MSTPSLTDFFNDLVRRSQDPCDDTEVALVRRGENSFEARYSTSIRPVAEYLLILSSGPDTKTMLLLVNGHTLRTCAIHAGRGRALSDGVRAYLKQYGTYEDIELLHVEIHKLTSDPIATMDYYTLTTR